MVQRGLSTARSAPRYESTTGSLQSSTAVASSKVSSEVESEVSSDLETPVSESDKTAHKRPRHVSPVPTDSDLDVNVDEVMPAALRASMKLKLPDDLVRRMLFRTILCGRREQDSIKAYAHLAVSMQNEFEVLRRLACTNKAWQKYSRELRSLSGATFVESRSALVVHDAAERFRTEVADGKQILAALEAFALELYYIDDLSQVANSIGMTTLNPVRSATLTI